MLTGYILKGETESAVCALGHFRLNSVFISAVDSEALQPNPDICRFSQDIFVLGSFDGQVFAPMLAADGEFITLPTASYLPVIANVDANNFKGVTHVKFRIAQPVSDDIILQIAVDG